MAGAFQYKPKFVDIRVRPPKAGEAEQADDVYALKPGERRCDHPGCSMPASAEASRSTGTASSAVITKPSGLKR